jgi:hypothetical protein
LSHAGRLCEETHQDVNDRSDSGHELKVVEFWQAYTGKLWQSVLHSVHYTRRRTYSRDTEAIALARLRDGRNLGGLRSFWSMRQQGGQHLNDLLDFGVDFGIFDGWNIALDGNFRDLGERWERWHAVEEVLHLLRKTNTWESWDACVRSISMCC